MNFCPNCGNKVEKKWVVCPFCSNKLTNSEMQANKLSNSTAAKDDIFGDFLNEATDLNNIFDAIVFEKDQKIENFQLLEKIGSGNSGLVWLAEDTDITQKKALKLVPVFTETEKQVIQDYKTRLNANEPEYIVRSEKPFKINYLGQDFYIVPMDYIEENNLEVYLNSILYSKDYRERAKEIFSILIKMLNSIKVLHKKKIIHGNLKLENIFFTNNKIKFTDFRQFDINDDLPINKYESDFHKIGEIIELIVINFEVIRPVSNEHNVSLITKSLYKIIKRCQNKFSRNYDTITQIEDELTRVWQEIQANFVKVDKLVEHSSILVENDNYNDAINNLEQAMNLEPLNRKLGKIIEEYRARKMDETKKKLDTLAYFEDKNFAQIPAGSFKMGSIRGENCENPVHTVTISCFYMSKYLVTLKQWQEFVKKSGYDFDWQENTWSNLPVEEFCRTANHPIINVSWYEAIEYCNWRSRIENLIPYYNFIAGKYKINSNSSGYRLPTEAEWEYCARSNNNLKYSGSSKFKEVAWTKEYIDSLQPIGQLSPNKFGIYDMSGNVSEWCYDWFSEDYYKNSQTENPGGPETGSKKVLRGGSWKHVASMATVFSRYKEIPDTRREFIGFRICRTQI